MTGREDSNQNDLFFLCSLIEYVARKTHNERRAVVEAMGTEGLRHFYELADVYHCENIDKVADGIVEKYHITQGSYDNVAKAKYSVPTHWDIGKVMCRLVTEMMRHSGAQLPKALQEVYSSFLVKKIDDYNSSMYYENASYHYASLVAGHTL